MNDESIITFGKYKGEKLANVPANYLIWLYDENKCFGEIKDYIKENIEVLREEIKRQNNK